MEETPHLRDVERAAPAPFTLTPPSPWWYPVLVAVFFTCMAAGPLLITQGHVVAGFGIQTAAIAGAFFGSSLDAFRVRPRMGPAPMEIATAYRWCYASIAGSLLASAAVWALGGWQTGLSALFVTTFAATWAYERHVYPRAARKVRDRLA